MFPIIGKIIDIDMRHLEIIADLEEFDVVIKITWEIIKKLPISEKKILLTPN